MKFPILMYHRVNDSAYMHKVGLNLSGEHCSFEHFRKQMQRLVDNFIVWPLPKIIYALETNTGLPDNLAAITLDDGTKDQLKVSLPVLKEFALPATFFIMTGPLSGVIPPTFKMQLVTGGDKEANNKIANEVLPPLLMKFAPKFLTDYTNLEVPAERYIGEKFESIKRVKYLVNYLLPAAKKDLVVNQLFASVFSHTTEKEVAQKMFITSAELKQLSKEPLITIGCHTYSHYNLSTITDALQLKNEVIGSAQKIKEITGLKPGLFAYPAGGQAGYTPETVKLVSQHYRAAFITGTQQDWCSTSDSIYELPRIHERYFK